MTRRQLAFVLGMTGVAVTFAILVFIVPVASL